MDLFYDKIGLWIIFPTCRSSDMDVMFTIFNAALNFRISGLRQFIYL
jgi:hypothetical protein